MGLSILLGVFLFSYFLSSFSINCFNNLCTSLSNYFSIYVILLLILLDYSISINFFINIYDINCCSWCSLLYHLYFYLLIRICFLLISYLSLDNNPWFLDILRLIRYNSNCSCWTRFRRIWDFSCNYLLYKISNFLTKVFSDWLIWFP